MVQSPTSHDLAAAPLPKTNTAGAPIMSLATWTIAHSLNAQSLVRKMAALSNDTIIGLVTKKGKTSSLRKESS